MVLSEEDVAEMLADLKRAQREKEAVQADLERAQRERDAAVAENEAKKREYEAELEWLQSENVEMPICRCSPCWRDRSSRHRRQWHLLQQHLRLKRLPTPVSSPILLPLMLRWRGRLESSGQ